ncbi:hypothetical protein BUALT_Bualt03G0137200 [Buddleja alternifolia]|uniref:VQ domain-containing protein n=1 Tax=Buddleja alternifolia TaxID=168488 RepID=A0AAV6Y4T5_9LAMI|nr:hypothetical protein BUALT_Bualt03G0137200 [Buddleja alternifolia]
MEITSPRPPPQHRDHHNQSPTTTSSHCSSSNGSSHQIPTPPLTPNPNPNPNPNPITTTSHHHDTTTNPNYPTTFVQADTSSFKHVVQMLTGASQTDHPPPSRGGAASSATTIPLIKSTNQKRQGFKLYERRNSLKNGLMINTLVPGHNPGFNSPRKHEILSPGILDFPALVLSPATPLNEDSLGKGASVAPSPSMEEEKAIAEKKFYFHPSPRTAAENAEPQLLPLFPVTSPRVSGSSSS